MLFKSSSRKTSARLRWSEAPIGNQLLEVRDLRIAYLTGSGTPPAVDGVSFAVGYNEVVGLAGESGSGKSTIAHALLRVLPPPAVITGGQVLFQGRDVLEMQPHDLREFRWRSIAIVFQSATNVLNPVMTVGDQISDAIQAHQPLDARVARERAAELLKLVRLEGRHVKSYPHQLPSELRQRAVIASALALNPPLIILDDPTMALETIGQQEIMRLIKSLKERLELSILFLTPDPSLLVGLAARIAILCAGKIVEMAPVQELFEHALHPYTPSLRRSPLGVDDQRNKLTRVSGSSPDRLALPRGCRFGPRCPLAKPVCYETDPEMRCVSAGHDVACHLY